MAVIVEWPSSAKLDVGLQGGGVCALDTPVKGFVLERGCRASAVVQHVTVYQTIGSLWLYGLFECGTWCCISARS
jgi:hypothetical protein